MSVDALELVAVILAAPLIIGAVWRWGMDRADADHDTHTRAGDARAVHELDREQR